MDKLTCLGVTSTVQPVTFCAKSLKDVALCRWKHRGTSQISSEKRHQCTYLLKSQRNRNIRSLKSLFASFYSLCPCRGKTGKITSRKKIEWLLWPSTLYCVSGGSNADNKNNVRLPSQLCSTLRCGHSISAHLFPGGSMTRRQLTRA